MREQEAPSPEITSQGQLRVPGVSVKEGRYHGYLSVETSPQTIQVGPDTSVQISVAYKLFEPNMFVGSAQLLMHTDDPDYPTIDGEEWDVVADLPLSAMDAELVTEPLDQGEVKTLILTPNNNFERFGR